MIISKLAGTLAVAAAAISGMALAQDEQTAEREGAFRSKDQYYLAIHAGTSEPELTDAPEGVRLTEGGSFSFAGGFRIAEPLLVDVEVLDTSSRPDGFVFDDPDERLSVTSIGAGLTLDPFHGRIRPYAGAGLGLGMMEQSYDYSRGPYYNDYYYGDYDDYYYDDSYTSYALVLMAKVGLRIFVTPGVAIDLQARRQQADDFETEPGLPLPYEATSLAVGVSLWDLGR